MSPTPMSSSRRIRISDATSAWMRSRDRFVLLAVGCGSGSGMGDTLPSITPRLWGVFPLISAEGVARHDSRHATHVAGTIAGSGLYVPLAVASDPTAPMSASTLPGFGDELTPRATPPPAPIAPPTVADETTDQVEARYPGIADAATIVSFDFNGAAEELISILMDKPDAIDVVNNSWGLDLNPETNPTSCGQLGSYAVLDAAAFDAVVSGDVDGATIRRVPILFAAGTYAMMASAVLVTPRAIRIIEPSSRRRRPRTSLQSGRSTPTTMA